MQNNSPFYVYIVSAIGAIAGLLFGFDTGIISGALLFIEKEFVISTVMKEFIVSSVLLGAMFGSLASGRPTDLFGRKRLMLIISVLFMIGTLVASFASDVYGIIGGRILIGLAIGMGSYVAPLYIAEVSPAHLRGGLVTLNQLAITIGILCSFIINYVFLDSTNSWRYMFGIGLVPAILLGIAMIFLPESPRWLIKQNRMLKATSVLQQLRNTTNVKEEVDEITKSLETKKTNLINLFKGKLLPVIFLGAMLGFIQQVTGINTIIYYAPIIFKSAGFADTNGTILATIGIGIVNVIATIFAVFYLDKIGRRPLLLTGIFGMGFTLLVLSLAFKMQNTSFLPMIALACTFLYIICFAFSLGAILWLIVSEIFPLEVRATAMGIAVFSCWFWNFAVSSTFLTLLNAFGASHTFFFYASMCAFSFIFCYYKVPETKGISLEKIEENIHKCLALREIGQPLHPALSEVHEITN